MKGSTAHGTKPKKPQKVNKRGYVGQFALPKEHRQQRR